MGANVLVVTMRGDLHAHAVCWALAQLGHRAQRWFGHDLAAVPATTTLGVDGMHTRVSGPDGDITLEEQHAVWLRRFAIPEPSEALPAGDRIVAQRESRDFLRGLTFIMRPDALWANPPAAQALAAHKAPQLVAARDAGLRIPRTVMTNDVQAVAELMATVRGPVIYKGFHPAVWGTGVDQVVLQTVVVTEDDLRDPQSLRASPGIFQEFVPKRTELRVSLFGRTCIAAEISGQDEIDWRTTGRVRLAPYSLPAEIEARLFALMDRLGLVMGMADLIVTPDGEHVFLEINEQGQFLWVEALNPELAVLEPFVGFLASADPRFRWRSGDRPRLRYADYLASLDYQQFAATEYPRLPKSTITVPDSTTARRHL